MRTIILIGIWTMLGIGIGSLGRQYYDNHPKGDMLLVCNIDKTECHSFPRQFVIECMKAIEL